MEPWEYKPAHDLELTPLERARSVRRESGVGSFFGHLLSHGFFRLYFGLYHRLAVEGAEFIPEEPPFVLIANHASHLDAMVLASALPRHLCGRVFPIAAGDVFFETPGMSFFAAGLLNALPMWRKNCGPHALAELRTRLIEEPCGYILFPEGARSRDGNMLPFKAGLGMLAAGTTAPIIPCHLSATLEAFPPGARVPRPRQIRLKIGKPLVFDAVPNARDGWKQVAADSEAAVRRLGGLENPREAPAAPNS